MSIIFHILFIVSSLVVFFIGGSSGVISSGGSSYHGNGGSACTHDDCKRRNGIIVGSIIGGVLGSVLLAAGFYLTFKCYRGRPLRSNSMYIHLALPKMCNQRETSYHSLFPSGTWSVRYYQYSKWHGPYRFSLSFDSQSSEIEGSGSDDFGSFTIDGTYSERTRRISLKKIYQSSTGNRSEYFGHHGIIQVAWNSRTHQFEGKWYVHTSTYHGTDKFELKCPQQPTASHIEQV